MFLQRVTALLFLVIVAAFVWRFPVGQLWLGVGFGLYALILLTYPRAWLIVVPAAMPLLDLTIFSGWFFFDEFDALILLTLAILMWRQPLGRQDFRFGRLLGLVLLIIMVSYVVSTAIALFPWPAIDGNSFASYHSPFNAVRIAKGFVGPLLLLPFLNRSINETSQTGRFLVGGLLLGLLGVGVVGAYEHWLFAGLLDFASSYRIVGPFSSMHTGDGHIDLWLAVTIPLIAAPFLRNWHFGWRILAVILSGPAFYVLLATGSRGPFLAVAAAIFVMVGLFVFVWTRRGRSRRALLGYTIIAALIAIIAVPFIVPTEVGNRFKRTADDFQTRITHWQDALSYRNAGAMTQIFGMGLGAFPKAYAQRHKLARYSFDGSPKRRHLTLRSGDNLYIGQTIGAQPNTRYRLSFWYRTKDARARLTVAICEKWLLHLQNCSWNSYGLPTTGGKWVQHKATIRIENTGRTRVRNGLSFKHPVWLTLHTGGVRTGLSLDDISFAGPGGQSLIENGSFRGTNDHGFWAVDNHLPWHTKNMAVNVLFDQGWLGLIGVSLLFALGLVSLARAMWAGYSVPIPLAGAMIGYLIIAVVVSPFDQPRLAMLFYLLCLFCSLQFARGWSSLKL